MLHGSHSSRTRTATRPSVFSRGSRRSMRSWSSARARPVPTPRSAARVCRVCRYSSRVSAWRPPRYRVFIWAATSRSLWSASPPWTSAPTAVRPWPWRTGRQPTSAPTLTGRPPGRGAAEKDAHADPQGQLLVGDDEVGLRRGGRADQGRRGWSSQKQSTPKAFRSCPGGRAGQDLEFVDHGGGQVLGGDPPLASGAGEPIHPQPGRPSTARRPRGRTTGVALQALEEDTTLAARPQDATWAGL